jgi:hypothetical protein
MQIMHWIVLTQNDAVTETVMKTLLGRRPTRALLLPLLLSGQVELKTVEARA